MDFFSEQDQARRSTKLLVALFSIAVIVLIAITNFLVAMTLWLVNEQIAGNYQAYQGALDTLVYQETIFSYRPRRHGCHSLRRAFQVDSTFWGRQACC
jgi:hypothetical protein